MDNIKSVGEDDWRAESDYRTLQSAAEIMADRIRMRGVLRCQQKHVKARAKLSSMLAGFKRSGQLKGMAY